MFGLNLDNIPGLRVNCPIKMCKNESIFSGSFCQVYSFTDESLIAETVVWPIFFLINIFCFINIITALKETMFYSDIVQY